jgi:2-polyprenyl-3-methyl-5-hydroxy-6-metoxy-1,4-benzoquinol methylase
MRDPLLLEFDNYIYAQGRDLIDEQSPTYPLFAEGTLPEMIAELRAKLREDQESFRPEVLNGPVAQGIRARAGQWFQRIDFPAHGISTTSDRAWAYFDEGGVNTLGQNLTSEEACLLRPWPKWMYLQKHIPPLEGKSILEVGSANGFFPFRFAELGAKKITGIDVQKYKHESAVWANSILGWKMIEFRHSDFLVDLSIVPHDIVFSSEVINHTLCPLWAIARLVSLAKETLILDTGVCESKKHEMELSSGWSRDREKLYFLSFHISDGLLCSYLRILGIRASEIVKYEQRGAEHTLYIIDTRGLHERQNSGEIVEDLRRSLTMELTLPGQ